VDGCVENTYYGNSLAVSQLGGCNGYLNINVSSSKILRYYKIWIKEQGQREPKQLVRDSSVV
jgi:hypothetical protein